MFGPPKCPVYVKLPWIGPAIQVFADKISSSFKRCFYSVKIWTIFTIGSTFLSSEKDVLPILQQSRIVYKFQCQCNTDSISRTI